MKKAEDCYDKAFERYFRNIGMEKKGVTLHNLICNVLKNSSLDVPLGNQLQIKL